jgi:hypothetical protein
MLPMNHLYLILLPERSWNVTHYLSNQSTHVRHPFNWERKTRGNFLKNNFQNQWKLVYLA